MVRVLPIVSRRSFTNGSESIRARLLQPGLPRYWVCDKIQSFQLTLHVGGGGLLIRISGGLAANNFSLCTNKGLFR